MTDPRQVRHNWWMWAAATVLVLPIVYCLASGPIRGYGHRWGISNDRFNTYFAPLVSLDNRTIQLEKTFAERALRDYWRLFPDPSDFRVRRLIYTSLDFEAEALSTEEESLDAASRSSVIEQASYESKVEGSSDSLSEIELSRDQLAGEYPEREAGSEPALTIDQFSDDMVETLMRKLNENHAAYERMTPLPTESKSHPSDELTRWLESPKAREINRNLGFE